MLSVTFSELRNNAKKYFDRVQKGETLEVYRNGKPVAIVSPAKAQAPGRWKTAAPKRLAGVSLSKVILAQREED